MTIKTKSVIGRVKLQQVNKDVDMLEKNHEDSFGRIVSMAANAKVGEKGNL